MADVCSLIRECLVELKSGESVGRFVTSNYSFQPGDVIFRNAPSSYILSTEYWGHRCLRCFSSKESGELLQCAKCKKATYCSKGCQVGDWKQHKGECPHIQSIFNQNLPYSAMNEVLLLLRSLTIKPKQCGTCAYSPNGLIECGLAHSEGVYYNPLASIDSSDLILASVAGRFCQEANPYLLRRLQQFHSNNFGIVDELITCIGAAEYPAAALLNHSCVPNCILRYSLTQLNGPILEVVAISPIAEGEELCHSYTDCSSPTRQRQQRLTDIYKFGCQCTLCSVSVSSSARNSPLDSSVFEGIIESPLEVKKITSTARENAISKILAVDHLTTEIKKPLPDTLIQRQKRVEDVALQAESNGEISTAYQDMKDMEEELQAFYGCLNQDLYHFRCKMLSTVLLTDNYDEARKICAKIVSFLVVSMANVANHPLLAVQLFTLADLNINIDEELAQKYYAWCEELLLITHGRSSRLVTHIKTCR